MVCTSSSKQYLISQVPAVLILHLKRFQSQRMGFRKVAKHVKYPLLLDLAPVCTETSKRKVYSLYGIVEHTGTLHGGHYVAYVKVNKTDIDRSVRTKSALFSLDFPLISARTLVSIFTSFIYFSMHDK